MGKLPLCILNSLTAMRKLPGISLYTRFTCESFCGNCFIFCHIANVNSNAFRLEYTSQPYNQWTAISQEYMNWLLGSRESVSARSDTFNHKLNKVFLCSWYVFLEAVMRKLILLYGSPSLPSLTQFYFRNALSYSQRTVAFFSCALYYHWGEKKRNRY